MLHTWPGNVRELENTVEHAFVRCRQGAITVDHLPPEFEKLAQQLNPAEGPAGAQREARRIRQALANTAWNKSRAAELLGMSRRTIYRKIALYGITSEA
jgi:transcriptional regulator of acetoin/glycerol metabolism